MTPVQQDYTELCNIVVNDFAAKKSVRCNQMLALTELVISGS